MRKNKINTAKLGVMFIVAAMALAGIGAGYSAWFYENTLIVLIFLAIALIIYVWILYRSDVSFRHAINSKFERLPFVRWCGIRKALQNITKAFF